MKLLYILVGVLFILGGIPLFWTPVPVGAVLILVGCALLIANSDSAQKSLYNLRRRHSRLDNWVTKSEKFVPRPFARILRRTAPERD